MTKPVLVALVQAPSEHNRHRLPAITRGFGIIRNTSAAAYFAARQADKTQAGVRDESPCAGS
jgi:hypothetical protein